MKITIIGGEGFVGRHLANVALSKKYEVLSLDLAKSKYRNQSVKFETLDLLSGNIKIPKNTDAVFYLSQSPDYRTFPKNANRLFGVNVSGAILAAKEASEAGVKLFAYASTGNVYKPSFCAHCEKDETTLSDPYALSKITAEHALKLIGGDMQVVNMRLFGVFGENQEAMLPHLIRTKIEAQEPIFLQPHPTNKQDNGGLKVSFSYVLDTANCFLKLATLGASGKKLPLVLNIAGNEGISLRTYAQTLGDALNITPIFETADNPRDFDLIADVSLMQEVLNPTHTAFNEAIQKTVSNKALKG